VAATARMWRTRPSELLKVADPFVAFCLDEAAAELLSHKEPPVYPEDLKNRKPINHDAKLLKALEAMGGVKIHKPPEAAAQ